MYRLAIYEGIDDEVRTVLFAPGELTLERWGRRINSPAPLVFSVHRFSAKATPETLRPYRRVRLFRRPRAGGEYEAEWFGYIEAVKEVGERIEVVCAGALKVFKKRYTGDNETFNGQGSTEAFGLLSDANSADDTGIVSGTGGVGATRSLTFNAVDVLSAWERLALAHGAEFEIDAVGVFHFVPELGADKSGTIELIFRRDGQPGSTVDEIESGLDGEPMANRIMATSSASGGLTSVQDDVTSQGLYGLLVDRRQFSEATDQPTLDAMAGALLSQVKIPITDYRVKPTLAVKKLNPITSGRELTGIDVRDIDPGDLVTVTIRTENQSVSTVRRVVELVVSVDANLSETLLVTLSDAGVFVSSALLSANEVGDIKRRLREVETLL